MVDAITVGTLNVCGLPPRQPLRPLAERAPHLCPRLDAQDIDVLNLQEVWFYPSLRLLRAGLRSYPYVRFRTGVVGPAGGLVTFSRLPLGRASFRPFAVLPGGRRLRPRQVALSLAKGVLTVDLAQRDIRLVNAHLTSNREDDYTPGNRFYDFQRVQAQRLDALLTRRRRSRGLTVLTGDLNLPSGCEAYPLITGHGTRRDPFAARNPYTYHPVFLGSGGVPMRVDYVLVDGDEQRYPVLDQTTFFAEPLDSGLYLSDHIGLKVQLGLN